jgi:choline-sulfatase
VKRPNILFIIVDQYSPRGMGCTGRSPAVTPALDRLAAKGTAFTSAITPNPVCGPARYCFYTGQYSSSNGVLVNEAPPRPFIPLAEHMKRAGYATANIGKLHATPFHERLGFDYCLNHEFFMNPGGISHYDAFLRQECAKRGIEHQGFGPGGSDGRSWLESAERIAFENWVPEDLTAERWTTDQSLEFIRRHREENPEQPFFLHSSYFPPHHPFAPIRKFLDQIPEDVPLPPNFDQGAPPRQGEFCDFSEDDYRHLIRHYYAFMLQLDDALGRLFDGLEALGIAEETIVIYAADHGDMIGEHRQLYKGLMYEGSVGIPLIARGPGIPTGRRIDTPVSLLDLPPTLLERAGAPIPETYEGRSIRPALEADGELTPEPVFSEFFNPYENCESRLEPRYLMVREGPWKLIRNHPWLQIPEAELYNLQEDPWERRNRIDDPTCSALRQRLEDQLDGFWQRQSAKLPTTAPEPQPRDEYRLTWPADGKKPVEPVA